MHACVITNDLRGVALTRTLLARGYHVSVVPGFKSPSVPAARVVPLDNGPEIAWMQVRATENIMRRVDYLDPDIIFCLHVESSDCGLVDQLRTHFRGTSKIVSGVSSTASQLETSKALGLGAATAAGIPVPRSLLVTNADRLGFVAAVCPFSFPLVLKADGLAGGCGTVFVKEPSELPIALQSLPQGDVVVQEFIQGVEVAVSMLCNHRTILPLNVNFEYKRAFDNDEGPNTPGMGTVARNAKDLDTLTQLLGNLGNVLSDVGYVGPLDISFMVNADRSSATFLEFTTRFGDPELSSEVLLWDNAPECLLELAMGRVPNVEYGQFDWAIGIVARGGQLKAETGELLGSDCTGTVDCIQRGDEFETCISVAGDDLAKVRRASYDWVHRVVTNPVSMRSDIGHDAHRRWTAFRGFTDLLKS